VEWIQTWGYWTVPKQVCIEV